MPKYPDVQVQLIGTDGNVFAIIGAVKKALSKQVGLEAGKEFAEAAMSSGSYDEVLQLCMETVEVY